MHPFINLYKGFSEKKKEKKKKQLKVKLFVFWGVSIFILLETYLTWPVSECVASGRLVAITYFNSTAE